MEDMMLWTEFQEVVRNFQTPPMRLPPWMRHWSTPFGLQMSLPV